MKKILALLLLLPTLGYTADLQPEGNPHVSGQVGSFMLGVANTGFAAFGANGNYTPIATNLAGGLYADVNFSAQSSAGGANALLKLEDSAPGNGEAGVAILAKAQSALSVDAASGDYGLLKTDLAGRLITTPAAAAETFQSCGTATAVTSDVAIKAAVASNRMYVTSITCKNTSTTVGPTLDFKDGSTVIAVGGIPATSATGLLTGSYTMMFRVPLRGTVNTAFNFATNTATTSVTCCAHGYISVD